MSTREFTLEKSHMNVMNRIQTGGRTFEYNECGKAFSLKDRLVQHHKVHTGEKAFCTANVESISVEDTALSGTRKFTVEKVLSSRQTSCCLSHVEIWRLCALW
ncbi:hypothetical protein GH733_017351, partial [Mirounga leonina]